ncbi:carbohydrate ABC transporter permease [Brevundimonas sp.]|uniref:carbohydrate ABC transporter permease n=1 Tax=Brevundimonas sp. TaxID=1871086 RepID=UPI0035B41197
MKPRAFLLNLAVAVIALIVLFPLAWMVSVSFMSTGEAANFPPPLLPSNWTLEHYRELFVTQGMGRYLWNSVVLATLATVLALLFTVPAGYAFAKLRFRGRERLFQLPPGRWSLGWPRSSACSWCASTPCPSPTRCWRRRVWTAPRRDRSSAASSCPA